MTTPDEMRAGRYVANRSGGAALPKIDDLVVVAPVRHAMTEKLPHLESKPPMAAKKARRYKPAEKQAILAQLGAGRSDKQVAADNGVGTGTLWKWKKEAGKKRASKRSRIAEQLPAAKGPPAPISPGDSPTVTLERCIQNIDRVSNELREIRRSFKAVFG